MTYIQPNMLLTPTEKLIKPYECSFIVIEGPNMKGKLNLEGLEIRYDSFYLSQLVLNPSSSDQPLMYGFLGENVTFLMVRAKYLPSDPNWAIETDQYIEYYFKDDPSQVRNMSQLMILTGNSTKRISQIFFNNPNQTYKVYIEVLMANLPQNNLTNTNQFTQNSVYSGLYWNSITSDSVNYILPTTTGSTELKILDITGNTVCVIPYDNIRTILKVGSTVLLIGLDTEEKIKLEFLSEFNCNQANSRINWVLEDRRRRVLTTILPDIDISAPVITWNNVLTGSTTGITSGTTVLYMLPSGVTYDSTSIKEIFIYSIIDTVDGSKSIYDAEIEMLELNDFVPKITISDVGIYTVTFRTRDIANNINTQQLYLSIYTINNGVFNSGFWNDSGVWNDLDIWVD